MAAVKALQQWCKIQCEGYRDVAITNMTTSFRDGLAFCALIHKHRPDLIDFDSLSKENVYENNHKAFRVAEDELGIPALLDAEDMVALKVPDRLSILTYVSQYYNYFHGRSPIGGMAAIKRPAEEPAGEPSGKKNQPVTAKVFASPKANTDNKREILAERSNKSSTLSSSCNVCKKHVHLVQRHLVDGKLYHRNCFKCSECSNILLSGTYKPGKEPNTFICKSHQNTHKPPAVQVAEVKVPPHSAQSTPNSRISTWTPTPTPTQTPTSQKSSPSVTGLKHDPVQSKQKTQWMGGKNENSFTPTPAPRSKPTPSHSQVITVTVNPPSDRKVLTESPKSPSSSILKTQEARKRFFDSGSSSVSVAPSGLASSASSAKVSPGAAGGAGQTKVLLRVGDFAKEKEKENEKEKAKSVISKMVAEESNKSGTSTSRSPWRSGLLQTTNATSSISAADASNKGPSGRVRLKPLDADLERNSVPGWFKDKKDSSRAVTVLPAADKDADTAPSDWRSMLKPVGKDSKSGSSSTFMPTSPCSKTTESGPRPWASNSGNSQASGPAAVPAPSFPSPSSVSSSLSSATPLKNGTELSESNKSGSSFSPLPSETKKGSKKPGYIPKEEILKELKEIETNLDELEKEGVELEKKLRDCEDEGEEDVLTNDLMVEWFNLIRNKQVYIRRESELVYIARTQDLEEEQPNVEAELRKLMEKPDHLKTTRDRKREEELMEKLLEIVNDRNAIVEGLDEDRLREEEEDEQLNKMMQKLDNKTEKKKKSPISKFFGRKSKRESVTN